SDRLRGNYYRARCNHFSGLVRNRGRRCIGIDPPLSIPVTLVMSPLLAIPVASPAGRPSGLVVPARRWKRLLYWRSCGLRRRQLSGRLRPLVDGRRRSFVGSLHGLLRSWTLVRFYTNPGAIATRSPNRLIPCATLDA